MRGEDVRTREKTLPETETPPRAWGRLDSLKRPDSAVETPPRAWGRPMLPINNELVLRNTPTCVGKTWPVLKPRVLKWKHPHVRGEDSDPTVQVPFSKETPPRAWGRLMCVLIVTHLCRNTPTCVGKTSLNSQIKGIN